MGGWEPHRPPVRKWVMPPEPQLCHARNSGVFREPQEFLFITCTQAHHNPITPPTSTRAPLHVPKATGTFLLHRPAPSSWLPPQIITPSNASSPKRSLMTTPILVTHHFTFF